MSYSQLRAHLNATDSDGGVSHDCLVDQNICARCVCENNSTRFDLWIHLNGRVASLFPHTHTHRQQQQVNPETWCRYLFPTFLRSTHWRTNRFNMLAFFRTQAANLFVCNNAAHTLGKFDMRKKKNRVCGACCVYGIEIEGSMENSRCLRKTTTTIKYNSNWVPKWKLLSIVAAAAC